MVDRAEFARVAPWLVESLRHGGDTHSINDVWAQLERDPDTRLWTSPRAAAVTQIVHFPLKSVLDVWLVGGSLGEVLSILMPAGEAWGRERGLPEMWGGGRPGWGRVLQQFGFASTAVQVKKDLRT